MASENKENTATEYLTQALIELQVKGRALREPLREDSKENTGMATALVWYTPSGNRSPAKLTIAMVPGDNQEEVTMHISDNGRMATSSTGLVELVNRCKGKYIALIEQPDSSWKVMTSKYPYPEEDALLVATCRRSIATVLTGIDATPQEAVMTSNVGYKVPIEILK